MLEELDAAVSGYDRRTGEPVRGPEGLAESYRILAPVPGGVAPIARDSGTLKGGRHIGGGRRRPGDVLYMAAMAACMSDPEMKALYGRLRERGKHRRVAVIAVMGGPVVTANVLLRDRRMWEDRSVATAG